MKAVSLSLVLFSLATASAAQAAGALEIIPTLGLGKPSGNGSSNFDPAVGLGLSVGGRLHANFSLAGQANYDMVSPDLPGASEAGVDVSAYMLQFRVFPAFHLTQGTVDFALGPTLGLFFLNVSAEGGGQTATASVRGYQLGFLTSVLFQVHPVVSIGPYFSYGRLIASEACEKDPGASEVCDSSPDNDDEGFWSLGVAAKF